MSEVIRYRGVITVKDYGDSMGVLFLVTTADPYGGEPLAECIQDDKDVHGNYLSVRYWTADRDLSDDEMEESAIREALGDADVRWHVAYSDITGYLWTDEWINVGGHDLLDELTAQQGRYCLLEIGYSAAA